MKMYKFQISNYTVEIQGLDDAGKPIKKEVEYGVLASLSVLMFNSELKLNGRELLNAGKLIDKLEDSNNYKSENGLDFYVFLTEQEMAQLRKTIEVGRGFNRNDMELVNRITNCEETEVVVDEKK